MTITFYLKLTYSLSSVPIKNLPRRFPTSLKVPIIYRFLQVIIPAILFGILFLAYLNTFIAMEKTSNKLGVYAFYTLVVACVLMVSGLLFII